MQEIDPQAPVLVTGATGYVAGWLVKELLDRGHSVHATVRDLEDTAKRKYLDRVAEKAPGSIRYFESDLLDEGSFSEAMEGCELVFHTASPFSPKVKDARKELVEPAVKGTANVLESVNSTPSVKRVVFTSSCAALYCDNADLAEVEGGLFTEADWNTGASLTHQPYAYSKTEAERTAWKMAGAQSRWDLVSINPSFVIGPAINPHGSSESLSVIHQYRDGTLRFGAPAMGVGCVDVRDLAEAHCRAGFLPEAKGRYIISGHNTDFFEMGTLLLKDFGDRYPLPRRKIPKSLVWLVGPLIHPILTRKVVARNIDLPWRVDNRKSIRELGMSYRPLEESMIEFFEQAIEVAGER